MTDLRGVSEPARVAAADEGISAEELAARRAQPRPAAGGAALRRHPGRAALPAHPLRHPGVDPARWRLRVGGAVDAPLTLDLDRAARRPRVTAAVTLECAGNGRARLRPRPVSQPWLVEAVGTAEWTGTPLAAAARARPGVARRRRRRGLHRRRPRCRARRRAGLPAGPAAGRRAARRGAARVRDERRAAAAAARLPAAAGRAGLVRHGARQVAGRDHRRRPSRSTDTRSDRLPAAPATPTSRACR